MGCYPRYCPLSSTGTLNANYNNIPKLFKTGGTVTMNEIVRTYILTLEMHLPTQDTLAIIKKIVGTYKEVPFYIQPFSGNA